MITIDTINFTPFPAFVGGLLIGIAVIILALSLGYQMKYVKIVVIIQMLGK